jgi:uncharacterized protein YgiM (DUF1202 family)
VPVYLPSAQLAEAATPNHDPYHLQRSQPPATEPVAVETAAAPDLLDADPLDSMPSIALEPVALRAEPEAGTPSVPALVFADMMLYAKDNARVRAAPNTTSDVLAKLDANVKLRATGRTADGAWWRVPLGDGRIGYVHQAAVTRDRVVMTNPSPAAVPLAAVASPQPLPARRSQGLRGYMDETMDWLADAAARGSPPSVIRTER